MQISNAVEDILKVGVYKQALKVGYFYFTPKTVSKSLKVKQVIFG